MATSAYVSGEKLSNCAKITHRERQCGFCYWRNCQSRLLKRTPSLLACISPVKLLLLECLKMELITSQRGGRNQIAEFPVVSLAEIWNNNPHQGQAVSSKFPIHWTMAQSRSSWSTEQHQGTQLNEISRGDLSLLKLSNNMIPCYLYYHMGSSSQVGATAAGFQEDNWFQFLARGATVLWGSSKWTLFKDAAFRL